MNAPPSNSKQSSTKHRNADEDSTQRPRPSLDTILEMMADPSRRRLLVALANHNPQDHDSSIPATEISSDDEGDHSPLQMIHTHLPKLADAELIEWDRDANQVQKGPRFDEICPLVEMIQAHADESSPA